MRFGFTDKMEESLSPALRDEHVLLYMQDILSEYMEYLEARVAKLREYIVWNLDNLIDESDMEADDSEMENFVQLLNSLYEVCPHPHPHPCPCPSQGPHPRKHIWVTGNYGQDYIAPSPTIRRNLDSAGPIQAAFSPPK